MSNLSKVLKEFEKDQLEEEKDHENDDDVTGAVLTENDKSHYQSVEKSILRPVVVGQKYTGVKVTREQLEASSDESDDDDEGDEDEDDEEALLNKMNRETTENKNEVNDVEEEDYTKLFAVQDDVDEEGEDGDDDEGDEDGEDGEDVDEEMEEDDPNVWGEDGPADDDDDEEIASDDEDIGGLEDHDIFLRRKEAKENQTTNKLESEQEKNQREGKGIISQMDLYDQMVKIRIRIQKILQTAALLPMHTNIIHYNQRASDKTKMMYDKTQTSLSDLMESTIEMNQKLRNKESILGKRKYSSISGGNEILNQNWTEFVSERTKVFDQTWESVKHGMGGNNPNVALNTVMQDTDRLLNRSRAKKSFAGLRIGEDESKKTDSEQYDDTGLYQSILRNVINSKAEVSNSSDPIEMTRHWLKLERMEKKQAKAVVDTKASKGRKVRYNVHQKLVGFFPKRDTASWSHQQRNQLFRGVFQ